MLQKLKNTYHYIQAFAAAVYFGFPSKNLTIIGITGTDGKTTTVSMLHHILEANGEKAGAISSINAKIGKKAYDTGFHVTTPSPWQVQKFLKKAVDANTKYFILEATSHGLDQNRLAFVNFELAAITNLSHEHFDYHKNRKNYLMSKGKLFKNVKYSVLNLDDQSYYDLKKIVGGRIIKYSLKKNADFNLIKFPIVLQIPGLYNFENALTACAAASTLGLPKAKILKSIASFKGITGRMHSLDFGQNFDVFIDFAHTPASLEKSLDTLKNLNSGKLIVVFGAAGSRDESKRKLMGKVASKKADVIILTAEDPRNEDVYKICDQIAQGINNKIKDKNLLIIPDRKSAIKFAIKIAEENDIVGLFGKGHEKSMNINGEEVPWNEFDVAKWAIKQKNK